MFSSRSCSRVENVSDLSELDDGLAVAASSRVQCACDCSSSVPVALVCVSATLSTWPSKLLCTALVALLLLLLPKRRRRPPSSVVPASSSSISDTAASNDAQACILCIASRIAELLPPLAASRRPPLPSSSAEPSSVEPSSVEPAVRSEMTLASSSIMDTASATDDGGATVTVVLAREHAPTTSHASTHSVSAYEGDDPSARVETMLALADSDPI